MKKRIALLGLAAFNLTAAAWAEQTSGHIETRHGAIAMSEQTVATEGGFTAVIQTTDDSNIDAEGFASFDLLTTIPDGNNKWVIYVEGNTSPVKNGVSSLLGEANADAGSALDRDGKGRFQVSELHYFQHTDNGLLVYGLLDVTASLDNSEVANDETSQFLSGPLVNNPTIGFPDYSLGMMYNRETGEGRGYSFALTSSHGLADNANASYSQLIDIDADGKGLFAAAEGQWPIASAKVHAGAWINTADHAHLDGTPGMEQNYGVYLVADGSMGENLWNLRAGLANDDVAQASQFLSVALERPVSNATLGLGVAYTKLSDQDATLQLDDTLLAEAYLRFSPRDNISVTPVVQWISNSGFDASDSTVDSEQVLASLRLSYSF